MVGVYSSFPRGVLPGYRVIQGGLVVVVVLCFLLDVVVLRVLLGEVVVEVLVYLF